MHNVAVAEAAAARAWAASGALELGWQGPVSEAPLLAARELASEALGYIAGSVPEFAQPESAAAMLVL